LRSDIYFCLAVCPRGHRYFIGDVGFFYIAESEEQYRPHFSLPMQCGRAWTSGRCNVCGATIGGEDHKLAEGNQEEKEYVYQYVLHACASLSS
jgi:hypothetical protein